MPQIPREQIEKVIDATDVVQLIGNYVRLRRQGSSFIGLCPFHEEKTPSFNVSPSKKRFYCFGCKEGGNAIDFLIKYDKLSFLEALRSLASRAGVVLTQSQRRDPFANKRKLLFELHESALEFFENKLHANEEAQQYLRKRGVSDECIRTWRLAYADDDINEFYHWAKENNFKNDDLIAAGLARISANSIGGGKQNIRPYFYKRLLFPIFIESGKNCGFSGRLIHDNPRAPKYLNTPETAIFSKGKSFFGIQENIRQIHRADTAIIVEGQLDLLALWQAGFKNALSPLGSALTLEQARIAHRHAKNVILLYDGDEAGFKGACKGFERLAACGICARAVLLPSDFDPDLFLRKRGKTALEKLLAQPLDFPIYALSQRLRNNPKPDASTQARFIGEALELLAFVDDDILREAMLASVTDFLISCSFRISEESLRTGMAKALRNKAENAHSENRFDRLKNISSSENHNLQNGENLQIKINSPLNASVMTNKVLAMLCYYCFYDEQTRALMRDFDDLHYVVERVPFANLLEIVAEGDFEAGEASSINAFVSEQDETLSEDFNKILNLEKPNLVDAEVVMELLDKLKSQARKNHKNFLLGKLRDLSLNDEEREEIFRQMMNINSKSV